MWHNINPGNADNGTFNRIRKSFVMFLAPAGFNLCLMWDMTYVLTECWDRRCDAAARSGCCCSVHSRHTPDPPGPTARASRDRGRAQTRARRQGKNKTWPTFSPHSAFYTSKKYVSPFPRGHESQPAATLQCSISLAWKWGKYLFTCYHAAHLPIIWYPIHILDNW